MSQATVSVTVSASVDLGPVDRLVEDLREWLEEESLRWRVDRSGPATLQLVADWPAGQLDNGCVSAVAWTMAQLDRALSALDSPLTPTRVTTATRVFFDAAQDEEE